MMAIQAGNGKEMAQMEWKKVAWKLNTKYWTVLWRGLETMSTAKLTQSCSVKGKNNNKVHIEDTY